ncbi:MAG TPA: acyltransferase [Dinghuibacter sp.]|uniref:acyltransferase family protein n=1 Tax=Dinghuibacter sp. TaxID=2024697 RepID=UPI002CF9FAFA|nr:acyltransferase [Dinghuibacter sp.]HTJ11126.1 acyltransferase [Dinghuibacter sp.]
MHAGPEKKFYFPNLDGLRAIGASVVMIGHVSFLRSLHGENAQEWFPVWGKVGVALFFTLSGFLITSLLLRELSATRTIRLKEFYIRRILRIWPLYYWLVILCIGLNFIPYFKIPGLSDQMIHGLTFLSLLNILLIIPNFTHLYIPYSDQRWSIIVEEMFYLIAPALVRWVRVRRRLVVAFCLLIVLSEIGSLVLRSVRLSPGFVFEVLEQLKYMGCIAVGCLTSVLFFDRDPALKRVLFSVGVQVLVTVLVVACVAYTFYYTHDERSIDLRVYCLLFAVVILNAALNPRTIFRLENPVLRFLGKISYGIYMYHMVCIGAVYGLVRRMPVNYLTQNLLLYIGSIALTIGVSWLSFTYFEAWFQRLRPKFQQLVTRPARQVPAA